MTSGNFRSCLTKRKYLYNTNGRVLAVMFVNMLLYIILAGLSGCKSRIEQQGNIPLTDTSSVPKGNKPDNSKYYTTEDTITIKTDIDYSFSYGKNDFNKIIDNHPELVSDDIQNPDQLYYSKGMKLPFSSEQGQDRYYMLYAYFLKNKNGDQKYTARRKNLTNLFSHVNSLFGHFEYGGTYFGHMEARILGYAEYSVYLYKMNQPIIKTYDIQKQKKLYIQSLRQLVTDESSIDFNTLGKEKIERTKKLHKIVDDIDKAITDNYYLRRTQEFHYGHFEYY